MENSNIFWKLSSLAFISLFLLFFLGGFIIPLLGEITKWVCKIIGGIFCTYWAIIIAISLWDKKEF